MWKDEQRKFLLLTTLGGDGLYRFIGLTGLVWELAI